MNAPARHALWALAALLPHAALCAPDAAGPTVTKLTWKNGEALPGELISGAPGALSWQSAIFGQPFEVALHAIRQIDFNAPPAPAAGPSEVKTSALSLQPLTSRKTGSVWSVTFTNNLDKPVELYWIDDTGRAVRYGILKPGAKRTQSSYEGHAWKVSFSKDDVLAYVAVTLGLKSVLIDGKGKEPPPQAASAAAAPVDDSPTPFTLKLRDGSLLHGSVVGADEQTLTLRTASHGDVALKRAEISSLARTAGGPVVYPGDRPPLAWTESSLRYARNSNDSAVKAPAWLLQDGGSIKNTSLGLLTHLSVEMPENMRIDIALRAPARPQFSFDFGSKAGGTLTLETWGRELVLRGTSAFISLKKLGEDERNIALTLIWDAKAKRFAAFNSSGAPMGGWQDDPEKKKIGRFTNDSPRASSFTGVRFVNKCEEIVLERLRISKWEGEMPAKSDSAKPYVRLLDGSVIEGAIASATPGSLVLRSANGGATRTVPTAQVDGCHFAAEPLKEKPASTARVLCANGDFVRGEFLKADAGSVVLQPSFSSAPVPSATSGITTMKLDVPPPAGTPEELPLAKLDKVTLGAATLHGRWVADGSAELKWLPTGCTKPVSLAKDATSAEIVRTLPEAGDSLKSHSLIHLTTGEILPANVTSLDSSTLQLDAPILGIKELAGSRVRCMEFGSGELKTKGFQDAGWRVVGSAIKAAVREGDTITLDAGGAFGHPAMLQGDDLRFSVLGLRGMGVARVRLFCNGTDPSSPSTNLLFAHYGTTLYAGLEKPEGQISNRSQLRVSGKVACRLQIRSKEIEVSINDVSVLKIPTTGEKRSGLGLIFECGDLWGNGPRAVVVSDFSLRPGVGKAWVPTVDAVARAQALTVPRFRKEAPPKQVLVAANGDLLRGELVAATGSHLAFRSGLESFQVPRERVAAAIWLVKPEEKNPDGTAKDKPAEKAAPPPEEDDCTHWLQLISGARFGLHVEHFDSDAVIGNSKLVGQCRIPITQVLKVRRGRPAADAVSRALEEWKLEFSPEPVIPEGGTENSPLLGKDAKPFKLALLDGGDFDLSAHRGKVVVLDFWATWCAPCTKSLPGLIEAMADFPADKVQFIGVNQAEAKEQVSKFLTQRGWKLKVALDTTQSVGRQFGVEGIPHTVIIGPDGKVAWVKTGYAEGNDAEAAAMVKKLLK